jgi:hypothetical protein
MHRFGNVGHVSVQRRSVRAPGLSALRAPAAATPRQSY